jgi:Fic family protein
MHKGLELLGELPPCLRLIRETHKVLLSGVRGDNELPGQFRRGQNFIGGSGSYRIEDARFVPPPPKQMKQCLSDFEKYLNREQTDDTDPLLVQLALIHYQFETIHPFRDGNGRIGRLLVPLLLKHHGRIDSPVLYVSAYFERHREEYVDGLLNVSQRGDWVAWINFFLRGFHESAEEAITQAAGLLELRTSYHRQFQKGRSSARLIRLIDRLFQSPSITIKQAAKLLDVSDQAAANNIHKLEEKGVLREVTEKERYKVFVADQILKFVYDQVE